MAYPVVHVEISVDSLTVSLHTTLAIIANVQQRYNVSPLKHYLFHFGLALSHS